ncbi:hypothetical protein UFOVP606_26 [uncultured Caudovirales phage]|uniref:Uncharacterized protein n=1 Tax=uncultured Caudovirales phage TaxID=2100421 RepID=A0A6J5N117_9CAUD|nr:hypothetical protein UFOVP606_26 [uncultured Caudovirales phage]
MKSSKIQKGYYHGVYKGIEWSIEGQKDGNRYWWYQIINGEKFCQPAPSKKIALNGIKEDIEYITTN